MSPNVSSSSLGGITGSPSLAVPFTSYELRRTLERTTNVINQTQRNDPNYMLEAMKKCPYAAINASEDLLNKKEFILAAAPISIDALLYADMRLKSPDFFFEVYEKTKNLSALMVACLDNWDKEDFVQKALGKNLAMKFYMSYRLRNDQNFFKAAINVTLEQIPTDPLNYRNVHVLGAADSFLLDDLQFMSEIIDINLGARRFAGFKVSKNPSFVEKVKTLAEKYKVKFPDNPKHILELMKKNSDAIREASPNLKGNSEFILNGMRIDADAIREASPDLKKNPVFMRNAMRIDADAIKYADDSLKDDDNFLLESLSIYPNLCSFIKVSTRLQNDQDFIIKAVKMLWEHALELASDELTRNPKFKQRIIEKYSYTSQDEHYTSTENTKSMGSAIEFKREELRNNEQFTSNVNTTRSEPTSTIGDTLKNKTSSMLEMDQKHLVSMRNELFSSWTPRQIKVLFMAFIGVLLANFLMMYLYLKKKC